MNKTLCLDFGNTRLKYAVFDNATFKEEGVLTDHTFEAVSALVDKFQPKKSILSSVINHAVEIENLLTAKTSFQKLSSLTKLNFTRNVSKPETIGVDRLALAAAAVQSYPDKNNLVIGLGSCITYNFINQYQQFLGGAISPGMEMRFKSMHEHTASLPLATKDWNFPILAYDTKTNLQSGVIAGIVFEIDGFINFYSSRYNNLNVVLTGGDAMYFARQLKSRIFTDNNFLFKGLYALSEFNSAASI